ncbi:fatty acyl-AMP ligase [Cytobacillus horneckiae]|uniref:AMP-binding protein n=1 Tax=Cytobacillus horneckiae TaxID=549687 RepID=A0A2N0ZAK6_9BACI|nr:fatty acyl-AMP ligase [Cytobacillus horneckiae]MEC1158936.1 fatty acyl-AMP ligase [Cytobacillus horneckiae]NRG45658.1 fatty acyl-AMP ligase [Bacillus sp. CRN 9]PKG26535.1 AMP-binding protein [Cytobacillus horneckiae]
MTQILFNKSTSNHSLLEVLENVVQHTPQKKAFTYLSNGVFHESTTYIQLVSEAKQIASYMQQQKLMGKRALIMFPSSISYIKTFLACLYAKVIAIPVYPPTLSKNLNRITSIMNHSSADVIFTTSKLQSYVSKINLEMTDAKCISLDKIDLPPIDSYIQLDINGDEIAFLQYTSGSTSSPKGVMVTHNNIITNEEMIRHAFGNNQDTKILGWLPLYHDMGLIGNVLQPLYLGTSCVLMDPLDFLQKPIRWLQAISEHKAEVSGGPNFAYELCIKKIKEQEIESLDLSSWEVAFNGAEPIRSDTLIDFAKKFKPAGFNMKSFYPCYGMAEATLLITGGDRKKEPIIKRFDLEKLKENKAVELLSTTTNASTLVSCGITQLDQTIKIVDPITKNICVEGAIGEIWVSGQNVAKGYLNNEQQDTFLGRVPKETTNYLKTGDLGFLYQGQLYVTGRSKDVIILRGKNFFPQDIEKTVEVSSNCLSSAACAAFTILEKNEEKLVVIAELERSYRPRNGFIKKGFNPEQILKDIRKNIMQEYGIQPYAIHLIKTGTILKTSSGKVRRSACKEAYEKEELQIWFSNIRS